MVILAFHAGRKNCVSMYFARKTMKPAVPNSLTHIASTMGMQTLFVTSRTTDPRKSEKNVSQNNQIFQTTNLKRNSISVLHFCSVIVNVLTNVCLMETVCRKHKIVLKRQNEIGIMVKITRIYKVWCIISFFFTISMTGGEGLRVL